MMANQTQRVGEAQMLDENWPSQLVGLSEAVKLCHHTFAFSFSSVLTVGMLLPNSVFLMYGLGRSRATGPWGFLGILFPGFPGVSPEPGPCSLLLFNN